LLDEIVKQIMLHKSKLKTTFDLKNALKSLLSEKKIAVVFQALRIETNKELEQLEKFLEVFPEYLTSGGRCLIITYHS
jgi:16S rRNA (cytosine1402-N4)-methyltransferase